MDIGYIGAFLGGILSLLSPCSVLVLPAFFAYAFVKPSLLLSRVGIFTLGLMTTLIPLGLLSGTFGSLLSDNRSILIAVVGVLVIVLGLVQLLSVPIPGFGSASTTSDRASIPTVFALGAVYAVAGVCTGPILGSVLMVASLGDSAAYGGMILGIYALGMVFPLFVITLLWKYVGTRIMKYIRPRMVTIGRWSNSLVSVISGALATVLGAVLLVTNGLTDVGGFVSIGTEHAAESKLIMFTDTIPDWWFTIGAVAVLAGVAIFLWIRHSRQADKG